jgi:hypothetical protein
MACEMVSCPSSRQDISCTWPGRTGTCSTSDIDPEHKCLRDVNDAHRIAIEEHLCHASSSSATLPGHRRTGLTKMGLPRNLPQNTLLFVVVSYPKPSACSAVLSSSEIGIGVWASVIYDHTSNATFARITSSERTINSTVQAQLYL